MLLVVSSVVAFGWQSLVLFVVSVVAYSLLTGCGLPLLSMLFVMLVIVVVVVVVVVVFVFFVGLSVVLGELLCL